MQTTIVCLAPAGKRRCFDDLQLDRHRIADRKRKHQCFDDVKLDRKRLRKKTAEGGIAGTSCELSVHLVSASVRNFPICDEVRERLYSDAATDAPT